MNLSFSGRLRRFWSDDGIFLVLMLALFALRFWPAFLHGQLYAPFRDNVWLYGSLFSRTSEIALKASFPYWIDTVLGGFPVYSTPHFSVTYPFYFFGLLNYGKAIDVMYTLSYLTCLHSLFLYLNLYVMLRVAGAKGLASLCGATIGLVCSNTEIYAHWITIAAAFSWFPLLVAGMIKLVRAPLAFGSIAIFSLAAALICAASPAQPVIQSAVVCVIFFTAALIWRWRTDGFPAVRQLILGLVISGALAFALAAVAFLPMALATSKMIRAVGHHPPVIGHASLPWESFNASQLAPGALSHLLFKPGDLRALGGLYVGPLAFLGILPCVLAYKRGTPFTRFLIVTFALLGLYCLTASFGTHFGLAYLHFHIPLMNRIREAARYLVIFTTLTALLAGLGLQVLIDFCRGGFELSRGWRQYFLITATVALVVFAVAVVSDWPHKLTSWMVLALLPVALFLLRLFPLRQKVVAVGLVFLTCLASALSPPGTLPFSVSEYLSPDNLISHRVLHRVAQIPDVNRYRVAILDKDFRPMTWADNASFYGIRTFYFQFTPLPLDQFLEMFDEKAEGLRELRGAKYFICGHDAKPVDPGAQLLFEESGYRVYEVPNAMEPYEFVHKIQTFSDQVAFRTHVIIRGFDYQHVAGLKKTPGIPLHPMLAELEKAGTLSPAPNEIVEPIRHSPNLVSFLVDSSRSGIFVLNERWSRDWHVRVNSVPAKILFTNFTQPGVALTAGRKYVEFEYKPMLFWYLMILQRVTFLLLVLIAAWKMCLPRQPVETVESA